MSKIKRFLEDVVDILQQNPAMTAKAVLSAQQLKFYNSNKSYIDSYAKQEDY